MPKYFIKTFGCAMNVSDSERIASFLEKQGFVLSEKIKDANLVIFNTCGIKQTAENRAYSFIHNLRKNNTDIHPVKSPTSRGAKQFNRVKIILTGCIAHRKDVQKLLKDKVDLFFSINNFKVFENWVIENYLKIFAPSLSRRGVNCKLKISAQDNTLSNEDIAYLSVNPKHSNKYQALVPIMTGCNNFCSYCVVPYARGREVSREAEEIIVEVKSLIKKGYKHITLLGQNVNSYDSLMNTNGKRMGANVNFSSLLKRINAIPGKFWISFVSSHPKDMDDALIETVAKCQKVCEWIHLPVQAGNDEVLGRMNRKYTQAHYLKLIKKIRKTFAEIRGKFALISVSSDIIVGFPGETKKQFLDSAEIMEKAKFDMVFFGQFSPRPGTVAFQMKDNVSQKEKARREKFLNEILKGTTFANNKKYVGKTVDVLIEKKEAKPSVEGLASDTVYFGKTRTMKNVKIISNKKALVGKIIKVKIIKANIWNLEARLDSRR